MLSQEYLGGGGWDVTLVKGNVPSCRERELEE